MNDTLLRTFLTTLAFAAILPAQAWSPHGSKPAEYIEGSLKTIAPHAVGTLDYTDNKVLQLRSGKNAAKIPFGAITEVEMGPARVREDEPVFKFWKWHERVGPWTSRYLTVSFKDETGEKRNIVLEMAEDAATDAKKAIEVKTFKREADAVTSAVHDEYWWGNRYWKTQRNQEQWKPAEQPAAPAQKPVQAAREE
jgi:hypothetical protein